MPSEDRWVLSMPKTALSTEQIIFNTQLLRLTPLCQLWETKMTPYDTRVAASASVVTPLGLRVHCKI